MKSVVHISTSDKQGGAAIAAWRLHKGMRNLSVDSRMVSRHRSWQGPEVSTLSTPLFAAADLFHQKRVIPAQPEAANLFSLSPVSLPLLDHPWIAEADVIHLHWVAQFLAPEDIASLCEAGKTVFWTFHDQWPYTGGCHYIGGTTREQEDWDGSAQIASTMHEFARMELLRKKQAFFDSPIHVIAPSRWMAEEAAASGVFHPERIHVVPYGIDTTVFRPASQEIESSKDPDGGHKVRLLFGCQYLGEHRKGYSELRQALALCMADRPFAQAVEDGQIQLTTFGGIPHGGLDFGIPSTHLGMLPGEKEVAEVLRGSSAFICPTLEDNLPNVVMESLACGCPVIAFNTGGIPDMVSHEESGLLAPKGDVEALAQYLIRFCMDSPLRQRLRDGTNLSPPDDRSLQTQASRILELYEAFAQTPQTPSPGKLADCLASVTVGAVILPHFGTEMVRMFLDENTKRQLDYSRQLKELMVTVVQSRMQTSESQEQLNQLQQQLHNETHATAQQRRLRKELKSNLTQSARRLETLKLRIGKLRELNRKLKNPPKKKSTLQRVRHFFHRRLKGN